MKQEQQEEEISLILKEAYSRSDLGEEWAVAEISSLLSQEIQKVREEERGKIEKKYKDIFDWLHGLSGDFPDLSQKPHYRFRTELRKRLTDLTNNLTEK